MDDMAPGHQLIIMRHAKAGELPGGPDFERSLRPRGRRNAQSAGAWLAGRRLVPDLVLCSKARRARQTWQYVSEALPGEPEVVMDERLYDANAGDLLRIFADTRASIGTLLYVGHNPAAAEAARALTFTPVDFPTSAIAVVAIAGGWPELADGAGELVATWAPHEEP
jgi:phosphohistidine phosphatase